MCTCGPCYDSTILQSIKKPNDVNTSLFIVVARFDDLFSFTHSSRYWCKLTADFRMFVQDNLIE